MRAHLLAVVAKEVDDGVRRCRVLWNAAVTVLPGVIASVSPLGGFPGRDQESVYHHGRLSLLIPSAVRLARIITPPLALTPGTRLGVYEVTARSAPAAWARCIARATRSSIATSRIKVLPDVVRAAIPIGSRASRAKRRRSRR